MICTDDEVDEAESKETKKAAADRETKNAAEVRSFLCELQSDCLMPSTVV